MNLYDVFICHASEDKADFVRPLADALRQQHLEVWYDEFSLELGDSLRRSIDLGLARSRYGVVVLSPYFFEKQWSQWELDGLVSRQNKGPNKVILPIWHNITRDVILEHSPPLADLVAVSSANEMNEVVSQILRVVKPRGSPLLIARDRLLERGLNPPVVTDDWWLDVVEASNREYPWGFTLHRIPWGRWAFPLPGDSHDATERGERLAWTALQLAWAEEAEKRSISQVTRPEMVVDFIESQPGLLDMCGLYPEFVATYAPQLTITGNGGTLESTFETCLQRSLEHHAHLAKASPSLGTALTSDGNPPLCDKWIAWRHPTLGNYTPAHLACQFVQGELGGPSPQEFATVDYLVWLLAESSSWLPSNIRATLLEGMRDWSTWLWGQYPTGEESELGLKGYPEMGALQVQIFKAKSLRSFRISAKALKDIESRFEFSRDLLGIGQPLQELVESFCAGGFVDKYVRSWVRRNTKRKQKRRP